MDLYAENILDHYRHPIGKIEDETVFDVSNRELNPSCGDEITVGLSIINGKIVKMGWKGTGCAVSQAAISMLAEKLKESTPNTEYVLKFSKEDLIKMLGVPISDRRMKCAFLGIHAVKNAIRIQSDKQPISLSEEIES